MIEDSIVKPRTTASARVRLGLAGAVLIFGGLFASGAGLTYLNNLVLGGSLLLMCVGVVFSLVAAAAAKADGVSGRKSSSCLVPVAVAALGVLLVILVVFVAANVAHQ